MFSRKPKNIVSQVIKLTTDLDAKQASHTWMDKDETRQARFGSTSRETFRERRQIDRERKTIARYSDSRIGTSATRARGDLARAANREREKINNRFETQNKDKPIIVNPIPPQPEGFSGNVETSFQPDFRPKL
ncbi:MAG: hypothetical protein Q7T74_03240 [Candidatus Saccharibacteria bacterium]|nr:hypothetical protein [Candidatus Saccharibacteria bacterium]